MSSRQNTKRRGKDAVSGLIPGDQVMKVKIIALAILTVVLCGCQGLKQGAVQQQPVPGTMSTGNWEFVLQKTDTENVYVESNIASTNTPGTYDQASASTVFSLDSTVYYSDPVT